ncbi:MAG: hypothetical protein KatS3mg126_1541 [Lysobacteraceae bacterium]|nr:MAG: hypothetical protein KatS3mg126_1541 [Xanthomonadaceae bacterium]
MARSKPAGISRVDRPDNGAVGWLMRIRRGEIFIQEFFSDRAHGGKRAAQKAARQRYLQLAAELPPPRTSEGVLSRRNTSGVVGVRLAREGADASGAPRESYVASWREDGCDRTVRFSCARYGKRKAFKLACLARELRTTDRKLLLERLGVGGKGAGRSAGGVRKTPAGTARKAGGAAAGRTARARRGS